MGGVLLCLGARRGRIAMEALRCCSIACGANAVEVIVQDDRGHFWARYDGQRLEARATKETRDKSEGGSVFAAALTQGTHL